MILKKNVRFALIFCWCFIAVEVWAQGPYAPPVGQPGTMAIAVDHPAVVAWASGAIVSRGPMDITDPAGGNASVGDEVSPTASPGENGVLSLGDGGSVVLTFDHPIKNVPGPDFAVFENSFSNDFLELAFIEVSSDGNQFVRFDAVSLTDTNTQIGSFGTTDATNLYNLAGKYKGGFGTPFDLEELKDKAGLDINKVTHIKVIDVVGNIDPAYRTIDSEGRPVNDPWPTAFPSSGFDLDAIAVLSPAIAGLGRQNDGDVFTLYPNPAVDKIMIRSGKPIAGTVEITNLQGALLLKKELLTSSKEVQLNLDASLFPAGNYLIHYHSAEAAVTKLLVVVGP